jgi:hypothetical protein
MMIPESVKVGAKTYTVRRVNYPVVVNGRECYGSIDYGRQEILVRDDEFSEQTAVNTFLHELVHAIAHERMIDWGDQTEEYTESLAKGLHALIIDNGITFGKAVEADDEPSNDVTTRT